jgi:hypothetical protein
MADAPRQLYRTLPDDLRQALSDVEFAYGEPPSETFTLMPSVVNADWRTRLLWDIIGTLLDGHIRD